MARRERIGVAEIRRLFELAGERGGAAFRKRAVVIYTVGDGKIVRAEHFMDRSAAREAAGA